MKNNKNDNNCLHCGKDIEPLNDDCERNPNLCETCEAKAEAFIIDNLEEGMANPHCEEDSYSDTHL